MILCEIFAEDAVELVPQFVDDLGDVLEFEGAKRQQ